MKVILNFNISNWPPRVFESKIMRLILYVVDFVNQFKFLLLGSQQQGSSNIELHKILQNHIYCTLYEIIMC